MREICILAAALVFVGLAGANDLQERLFAADDQNGLRREGLSPGTMMGAGPEIKTNSPVEFSGQPITRGGAMLRSLLIPGWGESYLGYHGTARAFFWADVMLWASVISLEVYSRWREDQFLSFAADHSGAQMSGQSDRYYADIAHYMTTEAYNEAKLRTRNFDALYTDPADFWAWDSDVNRREYDHIRIQSRSAHNKIFFFIGAAALNRLISAIDSGKKASDLLKSPKAPAIGLRLETAGHQMGASLVLTTDFARP